MLCHRSLGLKRDKDSSYRALGNYWQGIHFSPLICCQTDAPVISHARKRSWMTLYWLPCLARLANNEIECLLFVIDKVAHDVINAKDDLAISNMGSQ